MHEEFEALYRAYRSLIEAAIHRRIGDLQATQDLATEVFRVAWQRMLVGEEVTLAWLYATARNLVGNEYRRRDRQTALIERAAGVYEESSSWAGVDIAFDVERVLSTLLESDREVLVMAYWEELTVAEISEIQDRSPAAVRKHLSRARMQFAGLWLDSARSAEGVSRHG